MIFQKVRIWFFVIIIPLYANNIVTNPVRIDGFGAQFQTIIYSVIYAELEGKKFLYTPFRTMEHNYNGDADFLKKKEHLVNFIGNFEINNNLDLQYSQMHATEYIAFFESNLIRCVNSESLKKIKQIFRANKNKEHYFETDKFNIAIHIRRFNANDNHDKGTKIPNTFYLDLIRLLKNRYSDQKCVFHIYSQGDINDFRCSFDADDIVLHINESVEDTFISMVLADALITAPSSLSYVAGILSEGTIYYIPFWHPPLPNWISGPSLTTGVSIF